MRTLRLQRWSVAAFALLLSACAGLNQGGFDPPHVSLVDLRVRDVKLFEQRYALQLRVQNPNPYELPIAGMDYAVRLNDVEFGHGVSRRAVNIPAYGEAVIEVDLVSNLWRLLDRVKDVQSGQAQGMKVAIVGGVSLANRAGELPFTIQGDIGSRGSTR